MVSFQDACDKWIEIVEAVEVSASVYFPEFCTFL